MIFPILELSAFVDRKTDPQFHISFYGPRYWFTWFGLGFFKLLASLPVSISMRLGAGIGHLFYYFARPRRHITEVNIALCFPELNAREQNQLVRGVMRAVGISVVETSIAFWGSDKQIKGRYTIKGVEHIEAVQAEGKGIILMGSHQTTLDLVGRILSSHITFDVLYRRDPNPLLSYMISQARERFATSAIPRDDTRQLIRNLRKGHSVWYAPDQDYGLKHGVFAPFFGVNAATIVGTGRIAQMGQAKVIPMSYYRNAQGHYDIEFYPPLDNFPSGDDVADATRTNAVIEEIIRRQPDQYLWVHRRFKTRPPGEPSFYRKKR